MPGRRRLLAGTVVAVALGLVVTRVLQPTVETVTLGGELLGAGGTGITSNVAVTDLTPRWRLESQGVALPAGGGGWFQSVASSDGDLLLQLDDETAAIDPTTGTVRWRVRGVLPVPGASTRSLRLLAGDELVTVDPETHAVTGRQRLSARVAHEQLGIAVGDLVVAAAPPVAFDAGTGEVRWRGGAGWLAAVDGHHGIVRGDRVDVVDLRDGSILYELPPPASGWQDAGFLEGMVVVADATVTALDAATGRQLWEVDDRQTGYRRAEMRISDGVVITTHEWSGPGIPDEEPRRWSAWDSRGEEVEVPPQVARATELIAHTDGTWLLGNGQYLDAVRDGVIQWRRQLQPHQLAAAAGLVVVASRTGMTVLDAETGEQRSTLGQQWHHRPVLPHALLGDCVVLAQPSLETARLADGEPCWSADRGPPQNAAWHVSLGEDVVVVQSDRGLQAYDREGEEAWDIGALGGSVQQPLVQLTPRWQLLIDHDLLYGGPPPRAIEVEPAIRLLDTRTGDADIALPVVGQPWRWVGRDDVAAVEVHDGEASGETRLELWELPTDDRPEPRRRWTHPAGSHAVTIAPDAVVVTTSTTLTELDLADGSERRRVPLAVRVGPLRAHHRDVLLAATGPDRLVALDTGDGSLRWDLDLPGDLRAPPTVAGDVAYLAVGDRTVLAVRVTDGDLVGKVELRADVAGAPTAAGGRLLVPTVSGLEAFGPELAIPTGVSSPAGRPAR